MKFRSSDLQISLTIRQIDGLFSYFFSHFFEKFTTLQLHSSCRPLNNSYYNHPHFSQRKQSSQLCDVFNQTTIAGLLIIKLAFEKTSDLRPRPDRIHLIKKILITRSPGNQLKSGGGESSLFHEGTRLSQE